MRGVRLSGHPSWGPGSAGPGQGCRQGPEQVLSLTGEPLHNHLQNWGPPVCQVPHQSPGDSRAQKRWAIPMVPAQW